MDALLRNRCESELLALAYELIKEFDLDISLNIEALQEGGIRQIWDLLGKNSPQLTFFTAIAALVVPFYMNHTDSELLALQKQDTLLSIEERQLTIRKLKIELDKGKLSSQSLTTASQLANSNRKIIYRKSNFYNHLLKTSDVTQVGFSELGENNQPLSNEIIIPREKFSRFILRSNKLPVEVIEDAQIEIVSPVLREGNAKWKGIYIGETPISFEMNDNTFKGDVLAKKVSFTNGNIIVCVLEIHRELDEAGEIKITKYSVTSVLKKADNGTLTETTSSKQYRYEKEQSSRQTSLKF